MENQRQRVRGVLAVLVLVAWIAPGAIAQAGLSDQQLEQIQQGFQVRSSQVLERQLSSPFPKPSCEAVMQPEDRCVWGKLNFALAALSLNTDLEAANTAIRDAVKRIPKVPGYKEYADPSNTHSAKTIDSAYDFHFVDAMLLTRIYETFARGTRSTAGRLEPGTERAIEGIFWDWARTECALDDADPNKIWHIWGSENHSAMHNETCWAAAIILRRLPSYNKLTYADGSTAAVQAAAWTNFLKAYIRQHAARGMLVEFFSPTYAGDTLQNFYLYYDFSEDAELKSLSRKFLDLWWADWAEEQIKGVHGGSKARFYPNRTKSGTPLQGIQWLYLGIGEISPQLQSPVMMQVLTSSYRLPLVVMDIAIDSQGRGVYDAKSRRPGLARSPMEGDWYTVDPNFGGIYRYTYCTPSFIMGASLFGKLPDSAWTHISDQNRWQGIVLDAGPDARIFALPAALARDRAYNQFWSVQSKATQIVQKIPTPLSKGTGRMQVWIAKGLKRTEAGGWIFVDSAAYVAVRPAYGGYKWAPADPDWMIPDEDLAPVIIQAAQKIDFESFEAFQRAVRALPLEVGHGAIRFTGLADAGKLTFYGDSDKLPEINGRPIDLRPDFAFESPFLRERWGTGIVTIAKGKRKLVLDFRPTAKK